MASLTAEPVASGTTVATRLPLRERIPRVLRHPVGLALTSAVTLWFSFPPVEWHGAAWFALVPLFLLALDPGPRKFSIYFATWLGGYAFWLLAVQWVLATDSTAWLGWLVMALALSMFWVGFVWATRSIVRRLDWPITVVAPVVWVALEYARAYVATGFPWYYLAHSQYRQIYWTQIADFAGSLGLSFLIVLVNAAIVEWLAPVFYGTPSLGTSEATSLWRRVPTARWVRLGLVIASLMGTLAYGVFRVGTAGFRDGPRVALLQSGEVQEYDSPRRKSPQTLYEMYITMQERAVAHQPRPDLVVWSETAYPFRYVTIDPLLDRKTFDEQAKAYDSDAIADDFILIRDRNTQEFRRVLASHRVPMMIGASVFDFRSSGFSRYNSAVLLKPGFEPEIYHKLHLVPFGEYVPLIDVFPWLTALTPYHGTRPSFLDFGKDPAWFDLKPYRLAAAICFEDTLPHVVRRFFSEVPDDAQPDLIVNLSNDGWFHDTSEHEMHLAVATFRCVENRAPMARSVNTGVSAMIDGNGRIVASLPKTSVDVLHVVTPLDDRTSLYSRWGDWLGQITSLGTVGFLVLGWIAPSRRKSPRDREPTDPGPRPRSGESA